MLEQGTRLMASAAQIAERRERLQLWKKRQDAKKASSAPRRNEASAGVSANEPGPAKPMCQPTAPAASASQAPKLRHPRGHLPPPPAAKPPCRPKVYRGAWTCAACGGSNVRRSHCLVCGQPRVLRHPRSLGRPKTPTPEPETPKLQDPLQQLRTLYSSDRRESPEAHTATTHRDVLNNDVLRKTSLKHPRQVSRSSPPSLDTPKTHRSAQERSKHPLTKHTRSKHPTPATTHRPQNAVNAAPQHTITEVGTRPNGTKIYSVKNKPAASPWSKTAAPGSGITGRKRRNESAASKRASKRRVLWKPPAAVKVDPLPMPASHLVDKATSVGLTSVKVENMKDSPRMQKATRSMRDEKRRKMRAGEWTREGSGPEGFTKNNGVFRGVTITNATGKKCRFVPTRNYVQQPKSNPVRRPQPSRLVGVSNVEKSESSHLQAIVYRPRPPKSMSRKLVSAAHRTVGDLMRAHCLCAGLRPALGNYANNRLKNINKVRKDYILYPKKRRALVSEHRGEVFEVEHWEDFMDRLIPDSFIAIHLKWDSKRAELKNIYKDVRKYESTGHVIEDSDIQLTVTSMLQDRFNNRYLGEAHSNPKKKPVMNIRVEYFLRRREWKKLRKQDKSEKTDNIKYLQAVAEQTRIIFQKELLSKYNDSADTPYSIMISACRDSFEQKLDGKKSTLEKNGYTFKMEKFVFRKRENPDSYLTYVNRFNRGVKRKEDRQNEARGEVGLEGYDDVFTEEEMHKIERLATQLDRNSSQRGYMTPMTAHVTSLRGMKRRTKFFLNFRYLWTGKQMKAADSEVASGVRTDVSSYPAWMEDLVIKRLEDCGIVEPGFLNGIAYNVYHDGSLGIGQHMDCNSRFDRPIITLRLFSDARLSFGCNGVACENGLFFVSLPKGRVLKMNKDSYVSDGIKHCVRDVDMTSKSAALILRRFHDPAAEEAREYAKFCKQNKVSVY